MTMMRLPVLTSLFFLLWSCFVPCHATAIQETFERACFQDKVELRAAIATYLGVENTAMTRSFDNSKNGQAMLAATYGWPMGQWCVDRITDFSWLFSGFTTFNEDLSDWNVENAVDMRYTFYKAGHFHQDLSTWKVDKVTSMEGMFKYATQFNGDISTWDVRSVTDMEQMFQDAQSFHQELSTWQPSSVVSMREMFASATSFVGHGLESWDVSRVQTMRGMFSNAQSFQGEIDRWDVSKVTDFRTMFQDASAFNATLRSWDVSASESFVSMFAGASAFDQDLCSWSRRVHPTNSKVLWMFGATGGDSGCPLLRNPNMTASPPGPFCHACSHESVRSAAHSLYDSMIWSTSAMMMLAMAVIIMV